MSLSNSLFLFLLGFGIILTCILFIPVRFYFDIAHDKQWHCSIAIGIWQITKPIYLSNRIREKVSAFLQYSKEKQGDVEHSVQIYWQPMLSFTYKAVKTASKRIRIERLYINCRIGFDRADYTAYSYGLFWTIAALLPAAWRNHSEMIYEPVFQAESREVCVQGIIYSRVGQLIGILIAWFRLTIQMMLEQNRKEQNRYENGLCRRIDGDCNGKYQKHGRGEHHYR